LEHHSHTHPNVTVISGTPSQHTHSMYGAYTNCGSGYNHRHLGYLASGGGSHTHSLTLSFGAADLGSPWYNHTHPITLVSCTSVDGSHTHGFQSTSGYGECTYCAGEPHRHTLTGTSTGAGGTTHMHTIGTVNTGTADPSGTPENHYHPFSFSSAVADSHTHSMTFALASATCLWAAHTHASASGTSNSANHSHAVSGNSGYGGEPLPVIAKKPIMNGLVYVE